MPETTIPHPGQVETWCSITVKERGQEVEHQFEENMDRSPEQLVVSPCGVFSSSGLLSCPLDPLALWGLTCHNRGSSMSSHQLLQWGCGWSHPWNWAWRLVIYRMPLPIQAWRIKFSILKRSIRIVGREIRWAVFLKRNGKLPLHQKQIPHSGIYTKDGPIHRKDGSAILATKSRRE